MAAFRVANMTQRERDTYNVQRGGTKKKFRAVTAPTAQTADFTQSSR